MDLGYYLLRFWCPQGYLGLLDWDISVLSQSTFQHVGSMLCQRRGSTLKERWSEVENENVGWNEHCNEENQTLVFQHCTTLIQRWTATLKQCRNNVAQHWYVVSKRSLNVVETIVKPPNSGHAVNIGQNI